MIAVGIGTRNRDDWCRFKSRAPEESHEDQHSYEAQVKKNSGHGQPGLTASPPNFAPGVKDHIGVVRSMHGKPDDPRRTAEMRIENRCVIVILSKDLSLAREGQVPRLRSE